MSATPYAALRTAVQSFAPTWRSTQQANAARVLAALLARPTLCLSELARALPAPGQPLHGRLKRLQRFLANPRLDELALSLRWLKLSYHQADDVPDQDPDRPLLPIVLDTTYFEPYAALIASVPCGSRALPVALATYQRRELTACLPPRETWPAPTGPAPRPRRYPRTPPAAATVCAYDSQNAIEADLVDLVWQLGSRALRLVLVADRGFARAGLFRELQAAGRDFVVRIDAETHVALSARVPSQPAGTALAVQPGERRWVAGGCYHKAERVPVNLLAVWERGQEAPWYLATTLARADWTETLYRWRMRIESTNRDTKTGVLLRQGGAAHALRQVLHLHRLLLLLCLAEWLCAEVGLQAYHDLAAPDTAMPALASVAPPDGTPALLSAGPAPPPPIVPHRGPRPRPAPWLRRFVGRGPLSYVRLGWEVLQAPDLALLVQRLAHWLGIFLWFATPLWSRRQIAYRRRRWWAPPA